jgi:hypothetical protein
VTASTPAEKRLQAITEAVILWRDRPGGDVGLAIALAGILDAEQPEPPAATALVRVLRECDRIERAVRANPTNRDFDGAYLACLRHIREAAQPSTCGECGHPQDQHTEADDPTSVGQCRQCAAEPDGEDDSWHDYEPKGA